MSVQDDAADSINVWDDLRLVKGPSPGAIKTVKFSHGTVPGHESRPIGVHVAGKAMVAPQ